MLYLHCAKGKCRSRAYFIFSSFIFAVLLEKREEKRIKMKNVYFAQPSNKLPGSVYLPYSVGSIAAYSWQFEEIKSNYSLGEFIFIQENISDVIERIKSPFLMGFSCYMWNTEYNLSLAKVIKKVYPDCITVFGGPDIPEGTSYLEEYPFIDILISGEGEVVFKELLSALSSDSPLSSVNNLAFRDGNGCRESRKALFGSISNFPSPYTSGLFDGIINNPKYKGMQFDVVFETNRGCPYNCFFCYWGHCKSKLRTFSMERVKSDIDWFVKNKISFCFCADANFGILDRDKEITDYIVTQKKLHGYPIKFETFASKDKTDSVFDINYKLAQSGLTNGVSVACQSLSPDVLKKVKRSNMSFEELANTFQKYNQAGIPTYTDLILGLPGDTYKSFCNSLFGVIEAGQHSIIQICHLEMLPNTLMNTKEFIEKYSIKTVKSKLCLSKANCNSDNGSRSEIVVETSSMSTADWKNAFRLSTLVQGFHCMGMLTFIAVYLRRENNVSYQDFYTALYDWSEKNNTFIKSITDRVCRCLDGFLAGTSNLGFHDDILGDIYWQFQEGQFIFAALEIEKFYAEIRKFLKRFDVNKAEFEDLLRYQQEMIVTPETKERTVEFKFNWREYFEDICDTSIRNPKPEKLRLHFEKKEFSSIRDYAERIVWKGKRHKKTLALDAEIC